MAGESCRILFKLRFSAALVPKGTLLLRFVGSELLSPPSMPEGAGEEGCLAEAAKVDAQTSAYDTAKEAEPRNKTGVSLYVR